MADEEEPCDLARSDRRCRHARHHKAKHSENKAHHHHHHHHRKRQQQHHLDQSANWASNPCLEDPHLMERLHPEPSWQHDLQQQPSKRRSKPLHLNGDAHRMGRVNSNRSSPLETAENLDPRSRLDNQGYARDKKNHHSSSPYLTRKMITLKWRHFCGGQARRTNFFLFFFPRTVKKVLSKNG